MTKLYKDFGDVFAYEGVEGFWKWWNYRGQYIFGIEGKQEIVEFDSADEVVGYEYYKLIAIPKNITATTIKKRLNKMVDEMKEDIDYWSKIHPLLKDVDLGSQGLGMSDSMRLSMLQVICKDELGFE